MVPVIMISQITVYRIVLESGVEILYMMNAASAMARALLHGMLMLMRTA